MRSVAGRSGHSVRPGFISSDFSPTNFCPLMNSAAERMPPWRQSLTSPRCTCPITAAFSNSAHAALRRFEVSALYPVYPS